MKEAGEGWFSFVMNPVTGWVTAGTTTLLGMVSKFAEGLPGVHEALTDLSMLVGVCTCVALCRVHVLRGNQIAAQTKMLERRQEDRRKLERKLKELKKEGKEGDGDA